MEIRSDELAHCLRIHVASHQFQGALGIGIEQKTLVEFIVVYFSKHKYIPTFNPNKTGGAMAPPPPSTFCAISNAQSSRHDTLWQFSFEFPAHFDTKFVTPGSTAPKLRNFLYMHVGPKKAQNVILCTNSMQIEFFHLVHIYMIIFTLNGWN